MTTFTDYAQDNKLPYTINYTLDLQWQPRNNLLLEAGYVGNLGRHQVVPVPLNQAQIATPGKPINGQVYSYGVAVQTASTPAGSFQQHLLLRSVFAGPPSGHPFAERAIDHLSIRI